jgi:hypothetical protein
MTMIDGEGALNLISYLQKSGDATYFLGLSYFLTLCVSSRKLYLLARALGGRWEPSTIFLASIVLASAIRFLSYMTLCVLAFKSIKLQTSWGSGQDDDGTSTTAKTTLDSFYVRVLEVMFNIGDFVFLTAYMMLV